MKKIISLLAAGTIAAAAVPASSQAASLPLRIVVNGDKISLPDAQPFVDSSSRAQVPLRFVSQALGAKVDWNSGAKLASVSAAGMNVAVTVGKKEYKVNGEKKLMDTAALVKSSRTFVPIRFVSEALGASVNWDKKINTIYIDTAGMGTAKPPAAGGTGDEINANGFVIKKQYESKLLIDVSEPSEVKKDGGVIVLVLPFGLKGADFEKQIAEAEVILKQKIEAKTVDAIIAYAKQKSKIDMELETKKFEDAAYKVLVGSPYYSDTSITVILKKY